MNTLIRSPRLSALLVISFFLFIPQTLAGTVAQDNPKNMAVDPAPRSAVDPAPRSAGIVDEATGYTQPYKTPPVSTDKSNIANVPETGDPAIKKTVTPTPPEIDKSQYDKVPAGVEPAAPSGGDRKVTNFWHKAEKQPPEKGDDRKITNFWREGEK